MTLKCFICCWENAPPFEIIMGHMPHRLRPMPPPPSEKYHGPIGPLFPIYKSGTEYVIVPISYILF